MGDAVNAFTHFDGKFFTTLKYLLFRPGKLTCEYLQGRRVRLMKPLQLYLIVTLLYFIFFKSFDLFYNDFRYTITQTDFFSVKAQKTAVIKAAEHTKTLPGFIEEFNYAAQNNAKAFVFIIIPVLALILLLFFYKQYRQYVPHLIFATHYFTFYLISWAAYTVLLVKPVIHFNEQWFHSNKVWFESIIILVNVVYLAIALRRVYTNHWAIVIIKTLVISQLLIYIDFIYKIFVTQFTLSTI